MSCFCIGTSARFVPDVSDPQGDWKEARLTRCSPCALIVGTRPSKHLEYLKLRSAAAIPDADFRGALPRPEATITYRTGLSIHLNPPRNFAAPPSWKSRLPARFQ